MSLGIEGTIIKYDALDLTDPEAYFRSLVESRLSINTIIIHDK
jgi:hypothetical protein